MNSKKIILAGVVSAALCMQLLSCNSGKDGAKEQKTASATTIETNDSSQSCQGLIGIVTMDSLNAHLDMVKEAQAKLDKEKAAVQNLIASKEKAFAQMADDFQRKMKINAFTSEAEAQRQYQNLQKMQADGQVLLQQKSAQIEKKQFEVLQGIAQKIREGIKELNKDKKYKYILDGTVVLNAADSASVDITMDLVKLLNEKYSSKKGAAQDNSKK